jgi:hypothetical protein
VNPYLFDLDLTHILRFIIWGRGDFENIVRLIEVFPNRGLNFRRLSCQSGSRDRVFSIILILFCPFFIIH